MFRVDVDGLKEYFDFDPERKIELQKLDKLIRSSASELKRRERKDGTNRRQQISYERTITADSYTCALRIAAQSRRPDSFS